MTFLGVVMDIFWNRQGFQNSIDSYTKVGNLHASFNTQFGVTCIKCTLGPGVGEGGGVKYFCKVQFTTLSILYLFYSWNSILKDIEKRTIHTSS